MNKTLLVAFLLFTTPAFAQCGTASWYGAELHGNKTASGERFNMHALTAAHRTLPLGKKITVTNQKNGKKVKVTINDRGPYHGNRIIDLSYAAAAKIGIIEAGTGKVCFD